MGEKTHHQKRLKSNRKIVETGNIYTLNTQIQDCSTFLDCYSHCNKKLGGDRCVFWKLLSTTITVAHCIKR